MNATPANVSSSGDGPLPPPPLDAMGHANTETVVENFVISCMAICVTMFCYSLGYTLYLWLVSDH